jgi:hypothetical protein
MKNLTDIIIKKLEQVTREVKQQLREEGFVVPVKDKNGHIKFGTYTIVRDSYGLFSILDHTKEPIITGINLPHTALLTANNLALGRYKDDKLLSKDQRYGYAEFKEQLYKKAISRTDKGIDHFDLSMEKYKTAQLKKQLYRNEILKSFEKLSKIL